MDAERPDMLGALVQQQNEQSLRLQRVWMREDRPLLFLYVIIMIIKNLYENYRISVSKFAILNEIDDILLCGSDSLNTTSWSGMTLKERRRNL